MSSEQHREKAVEAILDSLLLDGWPEIPEAPEGDIDNALTSAEPHLQRMYLERFGLVECPNCDEGTVTEAECCGKPRAGDCCGEPIPVPAPCPTCHASGFVSPHVDAAVAQTRRQERERFGEALGWAMHWIVANGCVPSDVPGALPSEDEAFDKAEALLDSLTKEGS